MLQVERNGRGCVEKPMDRDASMPRSNYINFASIIGCASS